MSVHVTPLQGRREEGTSVVLRAPSAIGRAELLGPAVLLRTSTTSRTDASRSVRNPTTLCVFWPPMVLGWLCVVALLYFYPSQ